MKRYADRTRVSKMNDGRWRVYYCSLYGEVNCAYYDSWQRAMKVACQLEKHRFFF